MDWDVVLDSDGEVSGLQGGKVNCGVGSLAWAWHDGYIVRDVLLIKGRSWQGGGEIDVGVVGDQGHSDQLS